MCSFMIYLYILTVEMSFVLLSHYNTITYKKESNGICRIRNNIIYYIYNYYLPLYPLKKVDFSEKYDLGKLAVWR